MLHPFTLGSSLASAGTYLPACSHGSSGKARPQQPQQLILFRSGQPGA